MKNTFLLCIIGFFIGFPLPIIVALSLNALKGKKTSKYLQTIFTAPHFISLVVLVGMLTLFFGRYGLVNNIIASVGGERVSYFLESSAFRPLYILSSNWQDFGWSAIIYIAALSNVDPGQHEAAILDGATRFQRVIHVDLPAIMPMVSVMLIMSIGGLMGVANQADYCASKAGLIGMTRALAMEFGKQHIRFNCICPGMIWTDMLRGVNQDELQALAATIPMGKIGDVEDISGAMEFLINNKYMTGQYVSPNGGIFMP